MSFKTSIKDYNFERKEDWKELYESGLFILEEIRRILSKHFGRTVYYDELHEVKKKHSWNIGMAKLNRNKVKRTMNLDELHEEFGLLVVQPAPKPPIKKYVDLYSKHSYTDKQIEKIEKNLPKPKQIMQGSKWRTDESGRIVRQETSDKAKKPMQPKVPEKPKEMSKREREIMQMQLEIQKDIINSDFSEFIERTER